MSDSEPGFLPRDGQDLVGGAESDVIPETSEGDQSLVLMNSEDIVDNSPTSE